MGSHVGLVYRSARDSEISNSEQIFSGPDTGRPRIYPFYEMKVGEFVVIEDPSKAASARCSANNAARKNGWKFKTRTQNDGTLIVKRIS